MWFHGCESPSKSNHCHTQAARSRVRPDYAVQEDERAFASPTKLGDERMNPGLDYQTKAGIRKRPEPMGYEGDK